MKIMLYSTLSEDNKLDKDLSMVREIDINLLIRSNVTSFAFSLASDITGANYMYIPEWGKYFFLKSPTVERNGYISYNAVEDVLMTYKAQIREESGIILRQENEGNLYITDSTFPVENRNKTFFKKFSNGFEETINYYLIVGV